MHVEGSASILALIELNHLTKTFKGKTQTVDALKDINLHIEQGDIFGIPKRPKIRIGSRMILITAPIPCVIMV